MISCSYLLENLSAETTNSNSILLCTTYKFTPTYSHTNPQTHKCIYIIITNSCIGSATDTHVIYRVCICTYQYIHIFIKSTYVCVCVIAFDQWHTYNSAHLSFIAEGTAQLDFCRHYEVVWRAISMALGINKISYNISEKACYFQMSVSISGDNGQYFVLIQILETVTSI